VQPALHAESGLVEPGHLGRGDLAAHVLQEPAQPPGGAGGQRRDGPGRQRDAEQLGQRLRGPLLGQNCPAYRYTMTAAIRGPYCTGPSAPGGAAALVRCPHPHSRSIS
jgi:hypothetical protein